jgi:hypothetical protein
MEGKVEVRGRGEKCKQLLDDFKETTRDRKVREKTLARTLCRTHFGRGCGIVIRQTA